MIQRIRIQNFRSLVDVDVKLDPLTVFIGRSGTGKTNFVQALRFLRDTLHNRAMNFELLGGRDKVVHPRHAKDPIAFSVEMLIPGIDGVMSYLLSVDQNGHIEEKFSVANSIVFHQRGNSWAKAPMVTPLPPPKGILLGAIPSIQESTVAYVALRSGLGCYDFGSDVLQGKGKDCEPGDRGYADKGENYLLVAERIVSDISKLASWKRIGKAMSAVNPAAYSLTPELPIVNRIDVGLRAGQTTLTFDVRQESEGFRRFLAQLLALYQTPSKQTLVFEHPETGLHPGALEALFDEFRACPDDNRGQILLTTHSPQFLDHFDTDCIRVVTIKELETKIDRLAPEQVDSLKDGLLTPGELLTVDPARIPNELAGVAG